MKWLRAFQITGLALLALGEITLLVLVWRVFDPVPFRPNDSSVRDYRVPVSEFWFWAGAAILFLLVLSVLFSSHRLRQLTILSLCLAFIIVVAWGRSYGQRDHFKFYRPIPLSKYTIWKECSIRTGDGGICLSYVQRESWEKWFLEHLTPKDLDLKLYRWQQPSEPPASAYPVWRADWKSSQNGCLDKVGIKLWDGGFGKEGDQFYPYHHVWGITLPYWLLLIPCLIFPAIFSLRFFRRWRNKRRGLCLKCGYNLKGSTDRCPECGTPILPPKESKAPADVKPVA